MKLCLFCIHLYFSSGYPGYSEYTPGADMQLYCNKDKWSLTDDYDDLHDSMLMAENCKYYEIDPWAKEKYNLKDGEV